MQDLVWHSPRAGTLGWALGWESFVCKPYGCSASVSVVVAPQKRFTQTSAPPAQPQGSIPAKTTPTTVTTALPHSNSVPHSWADLYHPEPQLHCEGGTSCAWQLGPQCSGLVGCYGVFLQCPHTWWTCHSTLE